MEEQQSAGSRPKYNIVVFDPPKFDIPSYISNYRGRTAFRRLYLIACCSIALREEAARLAVAEAKKGNDVRSYLDAAVLLHKITNGNDPDGEIDSTWIQRKEKQNGVETVRLEHELKGYKNNLIKESIRMGNEDLGSHYYSIGDLPMATKAYSRMRDYCTTPSHIASTALRLILVSIEQENWLAVQSQVHKIRNLQMKQEEATRTQPKTAAAMGLQQMAAGEYREAALSFLTTDAGLGDSYSEVLTSNDVAIYGGLCALASMSRIELQTRVLEDTNFRNFLELEPHIRRAISFFCSGKYSQCLEILESYRADYLLDLYLQVHYEAILHKIRTKSIVEYLRPFSRVTLSSMQNMFGKPAAPNGPITTTTTNGSSTATHATTTLPIEDELITLIESGTLRAKIDLEARVLEANEQDERAQTHESTFKMVDGFIREAQLKILRMAAVNAGLEVKPPPNKKGWANVGGGSATTDDLPVGGGEGWVDDALERKGKGLRGGGSKANTEAFAKGKGKGKMIE